MNKRIRWLGLVLALTLCMTFLTPGSSLALPAGAPKIGMVCTTGPTFDLIANDGYMQTPDGNSIYMWSFADTHDPDPLLSQFQTPGPNLCVTQGDIVTINLTNTLPEPVSIVFPGQDAQVDASGGSPGLLTTEAAPSGGTVSYSFVAGSPGTYIYESGSNVSKQVPMGLYGALIVRPSIGPNYAYDATTQFDPSREYLVLLADIDPDLHHAVEIGAAYDFNTLHNRYWTVNGRGFPDTIQDNSSALLPTQPYGSLVRIQPTIPGSQPAIVRMINVGTLNHPFHPHGNHLIEIAQDGRLLAGSSGASASTERFGETIGSGQTKDYILRWDDPDNWNPVTNPLPVPTPSYLNVLINNPTWYSGSPYLGYKGTLPTGTTSLNICGEWYFPFHSHALNEFANFDEPFGGMATLLRVDPYGGCFTYPASTAIIGGLLKSGTSMALGIDDATYYQVNPRTTTRPTLTTASQTTITVASALGFPTAGNNYYIRIDSEVMQVTGGQGTTTWTVTRGQLGTAAAAHAVGAIVSALANDWFAGFTGVPVGAQNFQITYKGKNCGNTTGPACTVIGSNLPIQTVKICNWTIAGASGCATANSAGWVTLPAPQDISVGSTDVTTTWTLPGLANAYIGTGSYKGQVRILVHSQRWTASDPTTFSTWGNLMKLVYDAP